jgi:hypothetical protein
MSEEIDVQLLLQKYKGRYPQGTAGDQQVRADLPVDFVTTSDADVRASGLSDDQVNSWLEYAGWNLWDFILGRASEGESVLIPRQEYETVSFVQQWANYPKFVRILTEELGIDGLLDLATTSRREVGTKVNVTRNWAASVCPILGRGIAVDLGFHGADDRREDLEELIQFGRRLQHGTWSGGPGFVSARGFQVPVLDDDVLATLVAQTKPLEGPDRDAFRRFNAKTELFGFMLHYDCRAGMGDTGPYPLPDGRFAIVRDHFLNETAYPWSGVAEGLPYCVTEVLVFPADKVTATVNEIMTTFTKPTNYLDYLVEGVAFARDRNDTPMSQLRVLEDAEMESIAQKCQKGTMDMYKTLAKKSRDEKIRDGIMVYTREFLQSHAMKVGLWDRFVAEGFDTMTADAEKAWPVLTSGKAAEVLTPVLLFGKGFPTVTSKETQTA